MDTMVKYFLALLAPVVLLPLIPVLGRLLANWIVTRPSSNDLRARLEAARHLHKTPACKTGTCHCLDDERGMSLVECLVALTIIMIGIKIGRASCRERV